VRQIADKYGVKYPVLRCNHKTPQAYGGLPDVPGSFYIDKHGKVDLRLPTPAPKTKLSRISVSC
jgi:hypothetical protein